MLLGGYPIGAAPVSGLIAQPVPVVDVDLSYPFTVVVSQAGYLAQAAGGYDTRVTLSANKIRIGGHGYTVRVED